ncbi:MAG: ATPase [Oceanospirillaceae bacterium]|nr:ATPase [Oceanospirillaceae bacterium]
MSVPSTQLFSFSFRSTEQGCSDLSSALEKVIGAPQLHEQTQGLDVGATIELGPVGVEFFVISKVDEGQSSTFALTPTSSSLPALRELGLTDADLLDSDPLKGYWREFERLETELAQRGNELMHSERLASLGTLAAGVAHEINNPLAYIKSNLMSLEGFLNPMVRTVTSLLKIEAQAEHQIENLIALGLEYDAEELGFILEDLDDILADLRDGSERIVTIVSGLRQFSHPSRNAMVETDLNDAVSVAVELSRNAFKYHAELTTELSDIPAVKANSAEITQVLVNLIVNASQAIKESGRITVGSRVDGDAVELWVADTGEGMASELVDKIFTPFFTTKPVGEGTGLGLAISKRIMAEHQGSISVESAPGAGTCFRLRFPLASE